MHEYSSPIGGPELWGLGLLGKIFELRWTWEVYLFWVLEFHIVGSFYDGTGPSPFHAEIYYSGRIVDDTVRTHTVIAIVKKIMGKKRAVKSRKKTAIVMMTEVRMKRTWSELWRMQSSLSDRV